MSMQTGITNRLAEGTQLAVCSLPEIDIKALAPAARDCPFAVALPDGAFAQKDLIPGRFPIVSEKQDPRSPVASDMPHFTK